MKAIASAVTAALALAVLLTVAAFAQSAPPKVPTGIDVKGCPRILVLPSGRNVHLCPNGLRYFDPKDQQAPVNTAGE